MKYIVWKIAPGVFQLPVSWNELLVVFHGHDLIKFNSTDLVSTSHYSIATSCFI